jgi:GDP-4-dehydro-6-deoxy-D-mannose reductase
LAFSRILVTGASGFAGRYLTTLLERRMPGAQVIPLAGPNTGGRAYVDLRNVEATEAAIKAARPDAVIHLAGIAAVATANANPELSIEVNGTGTANLVRSVMRFAPDAAFLHVSSGEVYGRSLSSGEPACESTDICPATPYARSKALAEEVVIEAARTGLNAVIARPFNHTGPGQNVSYVVPALASQIAAMEAGTVEPVLDVGSLDAIRDFSDVRDIAEGYVLLLEKTPDLTPGVVFNFSSGQARSIKHVLEHLAGLSTVAFEVRQDPARMRPHPIPVMLGNSLLARKTLGWVPSTGFDRTMADVLAYWRERVAD